MTKTCKLCDALAATQFENSAALGLEGNDRFSRDPDICDACLGVNFSQNPNFVARFSLLLGWLAGCVIALVLFVLRVRPVARSPGLSLVILFVGSIAGASLLIWLGFQVLIRILAATANENAAERAAEAERFYYLALWAALTDRHRLKRQMLKLAKEHGFSDAPRLADIRLRQI
jgi:hypothetical protein